MQAAAVPNNASVDVRFEKVLQKRCIRLVLYVPDDDAVLMHCSEGRYQLPRVCGNPATKVATACYSALRLCSISAVVLKQLAAGIDWPSEQIEETYLLEVLASRRPSGSLRTVKLHSASGIAGMDSADRLAICRAIEHFATSPDDSSMTRYPGWVQQAVKWADSITPLSTASAHVESVSTLPHSAVLRLVSGRSNRFLKWMPPRTHEARAVQVLTSGGVRGLARTLAYEEKNGWWLTEGALGHSLAEQVQNIDAVRQRVSRRWERFKQIHRPFTLIWFNAALLSGSGR